MRHALALALLLPAFAAAETLEPKFTTRLAVRVDEDSKLLAVVVKGAIGSKLDACWIKAAKLTAKVTYEDGKPTTVEVGSGAEGKVRTCIAKILSEAAFARGNGKNVATIELVGEPRTKIDSLVTSTASLGQFLNPTAPGFGTGVGSGSAEKNVKVGFDAAQIRGSGLSQEEIDRVIKARTGVFRACYQRELNRNPALMAGGKLVVEFRIGKDGTVKAAKKKSSTLKSEAVESCVIANVRRLKFPPGADVVVRYPFIFSGVQ